MTIRAVPKPRHELKLLAWRAMRRDKLRGYATIELPIGLQIPDVGVFQDGSTVWAMLPRKPRVRDGRQLRDERGELVWVAAFAWRDTDLADRWSVRIGQLVCEAHPEDFDGVAAAGN